MKHRLLGAHLVDAGVANMEVLMHRYVTLDEWSLRAATNAFWRLYWPTSRGGIVTFEDQRHPLVPGYLYLISPHTPFDSHCIRPFAKWYIHFNVGGLHEVCRPGVAKFRPTTLIRSLLNRACPKPKRTGQVCPPTSPLDSLEVSLAALRQGLPLLRRTSNDDSKLESCVAHLQEHVRDKVTLADLARFSGIGVRSLSNLFVSRLGFPPMRYLIELRLNHAMILLRHTDHTIDQVAEECGFPNRYYFTRMLSKYRRTTPAAFRKLIT